MLKPRSRSAVCVCWRWRAARRRPLGRRRPTARRTKVTALADEYVKDYFEAFPHYALVNGAPEVHPDRLGDHSLPALKRWQDREDRCSPT